MATDVDWKDWTKEDRIAFAKLAYKKGWSIGLHNSFCHIDLRSLIGMPKAVFTYGVWSGQFNREAVVN
jgi:hypothetical protein